MCVCVCVCVCISLSLSLSISLSLYIYVYIYIYIYISLSLYIYIYVKGHVIGVVGVGQDITEINELMAETKNAKDAADRTANELARLIDSANAPIFGVDQNRQVTERSQIVRELAKDTRFPCFSSTLM